MHGINAQKRRHAVSILIRLVVELAVTGENSTQDGAAIRRGKASMLLTCTLVVRARQWFGRRSQTRTQSVSRLGAESAHGGAGGCGVDSCKNGRTTLELVVFLLARTRCSIGRTKLKTHALTPS